MCVHTITNAILTLRTNLACSFDHPNRFLTFLKKKKNMFGIQGQDENSTEKKSHGSEFIHCVDLNIDPRAKQFRAKINSYPKM